MGEDGLGLQRIGWLYLSKSRGDVDTEKNDQLVAGLPIVTNAIRSFIATVAILLAFYPLRTSPWSWFYELIWERGPLQWLALFTGLHAFFLLVALVRRNMGTSIQLAAILVYMSTPFLLGVIGFALGRADSVTLFHTFMMQRGGKTGIEHLLDMGNAAASYDTLLLGTLITLVSWIAWSFVVLKRPLTTPSGFRSESL